MKYEYKVTTTQGINTFAVDGWRVVAMYMNTVIMERVIEEVSDKGMFGANTGFEQSNKTASGRIRKSKGVNEDGK